MRFPQESRSLHWHPPRLEYCRNYLTLSIDENIFVGDAQSTEISQSLYNQLVSKVNTITSFNEQGVADLIKTDKDLQMQINNKADDKALTAEITRAKTAENANAVAIATKASQKSVDDLAIKVTQLENNEFVASLIGDAVKEEMTAYLNSGVLANLTIPDNSLERNKVNSEFEKTLVKADTAMQPSVYDPQNLRVDIYSYAQGRADTVQNNLNTVKEEIQDAYILTDTLKFKKLGDALRGAVSLSRDYAQALLADYKAFTITIVDELPLVGDPQTFYLVPKASGEGYDKFWYITNSVGDAVWDVFGGSSTKVVNKLPDVGEEDADYILKSAAGCFLKFFLRLSNHKEIIHVSHVFLHAQYLFDEMIELVQKRNSCNLNHLTTRIISCVTLVLCFEDGFSPFIYSMRQLTLERSIHCLMPHILIVAFYVALENVEIIPIFQIGSMQQFFDSASCQIRSFPLLTCHVIVYKRFGHLRI